MVANLCGSSITALLTRLRTGIGAPSWTNEIQRAGAAIYPVPLSARELDKLIALKWLREGDEINRTRVGEAVATMIRNIAPLGRAGG
jgi:hypothetical protein